MARSAITVNSLTGPRAALEATPASNYDAADAANDHEFAHPGGIVFLHVINRSGATMNIVVNAVAGAQTKQMAEDKTEAIDNGNDWWMRIAYDDGYVASDGNVDIDIDQDTSSYLTVFKVT
jgi:hypothetical protein